MKEETLSDKISCNWCSHGCDEPHDCNNHMNVLYVEDVKEFIKKLKEEVNEFCPEGHGHYSNFIEIINKLAGDKLTKEQEQDK
jgi:hypothetical protein